MFKFLRKYNKWILAVGGTLLMIVFLIPQAIEGLAHSAGAERATRATIGEDNTRIRNAVWNEVNQEMDFIRRRERFEPFIPELGRFQNVGHWYLLSLEAERAGLVPAPGSLGLSPAELDAAAQEAGTSRAAIERAIAKMTGIERMIRSYLRAGETSDRRLRHFAARLMHEVDTEFFLIEASAGEVEHEPSASDLEAHLERYGSLRPGEGDHGFGYRLPHRVKLEWITVSAEMLREHLLESEEMSGVNLQIHWRRNPDGAFPPVESGRSAPREVRDDLLARLMEQRVEEVVRYTRDQLRASQRGIDQFDGYFDLPEDWSDRKIRFSELAERIRSRFGIELPSYRAVGDRWLTLDELDELEGISRGTTDRFGADPLDLYDLVSAARELDGSMMVQIQKDIAGPELIDSEQNIYFFRITDVDASRAPESVDEVRDELVRDLRRLRHFRQLEEERSGFESMIRDRGLLAGAMNRGKEVQRARVTICDMNALQMRMMMQEPLRVVPSRIPGLGEHRATVERIVDQARELAARERRGETVEDHEKMFVFPVEDRLVLIAGRIRDQTPLSRDEFELYAQFGVLNELLRLEEAGGESDIPVVFGYDVLAERHNFRLIRDDDELTPEEFEELDLDEIAQR